MKVLPLTREWIEIAPIIGLSCIKKVLPLTREWIEMSSQAASCTIIATFSLLRGSGLKSLVCPIAVIVISSPSYEGVD